MKQKRQSEEALTFLRQDPLRNIVPLKMLAAYPAEIDLHYANSDDQSGVMLLFPTSTFTYDRQSYPDDALIALINVSAPTVIEAFLPILPRDRRIIFKLADEAVQIALSQQLPLTRVTAFQSYTTAADRSYCPHPDVVERTTPDERLYPFFAAQGHDRQDVAAYFAKEGHAFTRYGHQRPVATCFTYQNFETVHEIGGVVTVPTERRKGYAKQVVETALASLQQRGYTPRYQVHEENQPSIRLAEEIGLTCFVTIDHWRYAPVAGATEKE